MNSMVYRIHRLFAGGDKVVLVLYLAVVGLSLLFVLLRCILVLHSGDTLVLAHENGWWWNIH
ncbi:hypothetical protein [Zhongshania aquimaris]|uniref:Uncharacterized protein n=1 Tax=Zhongshania aquimaris TaxID=2857107 RepID=A0ABS6VWC1_9GAMM|nr:hypothetical protein [Zhongshania aquimaris]MBW2942627.1 hypothetical protein [Zhongshania aquimaris]